MGGLSNAPLRAPDSGAQFARLTEVLHLGSAFVPAVRLRDLGDPAFCADHNLEFAYVAGAMANAIASVELVETAARAGILGFFGSAGLPLAQVEGALIRLERLGERPWGTNLIHSPSEPELERAVADLYIRRGVRTISASAYLALTPHVVRYRLSGIHRRPDGSIETPNRVVAKVSRIEVARQFMSPPPAGMLSALVAEGSITAEQAGLAAHVPVAQDITVEADSGGHTDNRPAISIVPTMIALAGEIQRDNGYAQILRVGAAGGIATPHSVAAAFAMGAAYVVVGSVHQACVESGTSELVRQMLAETRQGDVTMAPAADMFEMGVKVQVLKRGTLFAQRATKLYELYRSHACLEDIPETTRARLERDLFKTTLEEVWAQTQTFFAERDPAQVRRSLTDPKHKMALVFRWYLGQSSAWAKAGLAARKVDFQVWCGPAMGAFNEWTKGSFLADVEQRRLEVVARNLMWGAAVLSRINMARVQGVQVDPELARVRPQTATMLEEYLT